MKPSLVRRGFADDASKLNCAKPCPRGSLQVVGLRDSHGTAEFSGPRFDPRRLPRERIGRMRGRTPSKQVSQSSKEQVDSVPHGFDHLTRVYNLESI